MRNVLKYLMLISKISKIIKHFVVFKLCKKIKMGDFVISNTFFRIKIMFYFK